MVDHNHFWFAFKALLWDKESNTDVETQQGNANHSQP